MNRQSSAELFQRTLQVSPYLAKALEADGFTSIEQIARVPYDELLEVPALTDEAAMALRHMARMYLENEAVG